MKIIIIAVLLSLIAGCATTFKPAAGNEGATQQAFNRAKWECETEVKRQASGRWMVGGLLFLAIAAAANAASDHETYKSCMAAQGYTATNNDAKNVPTGNGNATTAQR